MTSLTPHRDAAERVICDMHATLGRKYPEQHPAAVNARVVIAVGSALTRALADELDRGVEGKAVTAAAVNAIGNAIVSVSASGSGHSRGVEALVAATAILLRITDHVQMILGDTDPSKYSTASVDKRAGHA